jgi:hypothetical protein
MPEIYQWSQIRDDFADTLLLGNGASIAVDECFNYRNLLQAARQDHLITSSVDAVFGYLKTTDFELVMNMLWHAYHINRALSVPDNLTQGAYRAIRDALIHAVRRHHAPYPKVEPHLPAMADFMKRFQTVLSLNYDLLVYWAMLRGNDDSPGNWFKDCFRGGEGFDHDWEHYRELYGGAAGATLVFYPHGTLALVERLGAGDAKIVKMARNSGRERLLDQVIQQWSAGDTTPLFVSEGDSAQKERAILRSEYLSAVYGHVMPSLSGTVVCYGWSLSENDEHIIRKIVKTNPPHMAISIHCQGRTDPQIQSEADRILRRLREARLRGDVRFFDAGSPGSWITPEP